MKNDPKIEQLLANLSSTKKETYMAYEIEKKSIEKISLERGLVSSTLSGHLADAILIGLPVDFARLGVSMEKIDLVESRIRKPPINSSLENFQFSVTKQQICLNLNFKM